MHYGTCTTHVPWCMPESLTRGFLWSRWRKKRSRHSRRMRNPQFYVSGKRPMQQHPQWFTYIYIYICIYIYIYTSWEMTLNSLHEISRMYAQIMISLGLVITAPRGVRAASSFITNVYLVSLTFGVWMSNHIHINMGYEYSSMPKLRWKLDKSLFVLIH